MVNLTWPLSSTYTITTSCAVYEYTLPNNYLAAYRVLHSSRPLEEVSINGLDANLSDWTLNTGTPNKYYTRRTTNTVIGIRPTPLASSTGTLTVYYYLRPNDLVNSTDIPFNGFRDLYAYHYILSFYGAYRGWLVLGDIQIANLYYNEYIQGVSMMKSAIGLGPNFNPSIRGDRGPAR